MEKLKENGIAIDDITRALEKEGVQKFNKAYHSLLNAIDKKKNRRN